ncbi:DUF2934 domain-containing protein [Candidatus Methylobacter favarea]|uniref:DUF2934 domain-containing protein n=1 Tax=Candidatus Methylobacter favarea TaxID=2707345 RepID=UPI00157C3520|nr:DUF2934 domain-containing protein [Candidatus Methylobacter favarea]
MKAVNKLIPIARNGSRDAEKFQKMTAECACFKALKKGFAALMCWKPGLKAEKAVGNHYFQWFIEV